MKTSAAVIMAGVIGLLITAVSGFTVVPWLQKLEFGSVSPDRKRNKNEIPTMGGLMLALGFCASVAVTVVTDKLLGGNIVASGSMDASEQYTKLWSGLLMTLCFGLIGFADDYIKAKTHRPLGLTVRQKSVAQLVVALVYIVSLSMCMGGLPYMFIPFVGMVHMGVFYWVFGIIIIYAAVNAVGFTGGVDGLCTGVTLTTAVTLGVIAAMKGLFGFSMSASALAGVCVGFLLWNKNPSKIYLGETGSMLLGGAVIALAFSINCPLILLPAGIVFLVEGISAVLQVVCYRLNGKRILKAAPLHRHLEMSGMSKNKTVIVFTAVNILGGMAAVALMYFGGYAG